MFYSAIKYGCYFTSGTNFMSKNTLLELHVLLCFLYLFYGYIVCINSTVNVKQYECDPILSANKILVFRMFLSDICYTLILMLVL